MALLQAGCFFPSTVLNHRTSVEQELTTYALERAVARLDLEALPLISPLALRISVAEDADLVFLRALLERRLRALGITLVPEGGVEILHVFLPLSGCDMSTSLIGIPIGTAAQGIPATDISIYRNDTQYGRARIMAELLAPDGTLLDEVPEVTEVVSITGETFFLIIGPFRSSEPDDWRYSERSSSWARLGNSVRTPK